MGKIPMKLFIFDFGKTITYQSDYLTLSKKRISYFNTIIMNEFPPTIKTMEKLMKNIKYCQSMTFHGKMAKMKISDFLRTKIDMGLSMFKKTVKTFHSLHGKTNLKDFKNLENYSGGEFSV